MLETILIDRKLRNLQVVFDGGELTKIVNKNGKPGVLQTYRCPLCEKCYRRECFFIKHVEYCESVMHA